MRNRLTFANVIGVLLENKKKTYPQHQLVRSLFSAYLDDTLTASELIADDTTMYSRWCNGARPIPIDILKTYEDEDEWDTMEDDFRDKIIPNLLNEALANMLVQNKEYDSALEIIDFCESTIDEVMGRNNLDYGMCEFYRGVIAYTRSQPVNRVEGE